MHRPPPHHTHPTPRVHTFSKGTRKFLTDGDYILLHGLQTKPKQVEGESQMKVCSTCTGQHVHHSVTVLKQLVSNAYFRVQRFLTPTSA